MGTQYSTLEFGRYVKATIAYNYRWYARINSSNQKCAFKNIGLIHFYIPGFRKYFISIFFWVINKLP